MSFAKQIRNATAPYEIPNWALLDTKNLSSLNALEIVDTGYLDNQPYRYFRSISFAGNCMEFVTQIDNDGGHYMSNYTFKLDCEETTNAYECEGLQDRWCNRYVFTHLG